MKLAQQLLHNEIALFERQFKINISSRTPLVDRIMRFIIKRKGKQMRPLFVLLAAKINGPVNDAAYRAASMIELLHTATLVHDDIVDDAHQRRGFFSINALFKNKVAVLIGDYLLAKGLLLAVEHKEYIILELVSKAVKEMSEGELLQIEKTRKLNVEEDVYFEIIRSKTASLLAASCAAGAYAASRDEAIAEKFRLFGEYLGISFQIKDDLFDYGTDNVGKPLGIDIKEKKLTLPIIYTLQQVDESTRKKMIHIIKKQNTNKAKVNEVIQLVIDNGGIKYAEEKMRAYQNEALDILNTFPDSEAKVAMIDLVDYVTKRNH